jgi:hypothetical protein
MYFSSSMLASEGSRLARIALSHVTREYPNKLDHVLSGPEDLRGPRDLHPIFYGSFDWHSCVHSYWLLTHLYRTLPALAETSNIAALMDAHFTHENVAGEVAYLQQPGRATFERTYGWAWLLKLAAELTQHGTEAGRRWSRALEPLAAAFVERFLDFLPRATYPIRGGAHFNSAFALALALEYPDVRLAASIREKATAWYAGDRDCPAWEPSGDDFLSPALMEAECMRRVLPSETFLGWLDRFLPGLAQRHPAALLVPAVVSDRSDGKIAHLDGLNLSRAFCLRSLARALPAGDSRRDVVLDAAERHLAASLPHVTGDYMGEHWLATYALMALTA